MTVAYQSSTQTGFALGPITITKPTGTVDGDLLVLIVNNSNNAMTVATPSGWTDVGRFQSTDISATLNVFYKVAVSEGANYTISDGLEMAAILLRINGQEVIGPVYVFNSGEQLNTAIPSINATITPTTSDSLLIMVCATNNVSTPTGVSAQAIATSNPTWTEREELSDITYGVLSVATALRSQVTATGNSSFTITGGSASTDSAVFLMAVKRLTQFTFTQADTITDTDNLASVIRNRTIVILDTITDTDNLASVIRNIWSRVTKQVTSWTFTNKN